VEPEKSLLHFFLLAFFLIRVREPAPLSGFLGRGYLASYLAFLPKSRHFCPKTGDFAYFRTYIVFLLWSSIIPTHIVQNQRTNQPVSALVITILPFQRLTRNQFGSNATWVRIPPSAPKTAPCGVLSFIFATNYARAARWDSNSPCPALCVPPGCNNPVGCCKGAGTPTICTISAVESKDFTADALGGFSGATTPSSVGESKKDYIVKRPSGIMKVRSANCTNKIPGGL
jgi:hypothetical protein